ncbi:MAG: hypothetical protein SPK13_07545 [Treponema sp.]|nr:hypothetical protein [Treponema sp.]
MTDIQKFSSDVKKIIKMNRFQGGSLNLEDTCEKIIQQFERASSVPASLSGSVASYWKTTYIDTSNEQENEPTQEHLDVLCGFLSFLENSDENSDLISNSDWKELSELVNCEAETLPIEILQQLMSILVEKGVF